MAARVKGHRLVLKHNGKKKRAESKWTAICTCGDFEQTEPQQTDARKAYSTHIEGEREKQAKKVSLTEKQRQMLEYPPTPETWECGECAFYNAGKRDNCVWCRKTKPKKPKLLWPEYETLCEKVGIGVGYRWKKTDTGPKMRLRGEHWVDAPEVTL